MEFYIWIYERASELYVRAREKIKNLRLTMEMQSIRKMQLNSARRKREEIESFEFFSFVKERESLQRIEQRNAESLKTA